MCALIHRNRFFHRRPRRYQTGSATRESDTRKTSASSRRRPTCTRRGPRSAPPTCRLTAARQTLPPLPTQPVSSQTQTLRTVSADLEHEQRILESPLIMKVGWLLLFSSNFQNKSMKGSFPTAKEVILNIT